MDTRDEVQQEESMTFTVTDKDGNETELELIFSFFSDEFGKDYIIYTDQSSDANGNTKVFASVYKPDSEDNVLYPIETEEEWALIERILDHLQNAVQSTDNWDITAVD